MVRFFALLPMAWYGAGLIAEDRRLGAHLLYFSRPLTRLDYFLGKFLGAAVFGAFGLLLPVISICSVASFSSPEWSFVKEQWDVILKAIGFCLGWIAAATTFVLAISSLVERKTLALAAVVGFNALTFAAAMSLTEVTRDDRFIAISPLTSSQVIVEWLFDRDLSFDTPMVYAWSCIATVVGVSAAILLVRLRKVEVVG